MAIAKSIFKSLFKGYSRGFAGGETTGPDQTNLLVYWPNSPIVDGKLIARAPSSSHTIQQVKGSGFAGIGSGTIAGILTTDDLTSSGPNNPTCTVDGTVTFGADFWDFYWHRDGVLMGYYPGINVGGTFEIGAKGVGNVLYLTDTTITECLDGTGTNYANEAGFTVGDGVTTYLDASGFTPVGVGWRIPALLDGTGSAAWSWEYSTTVPIIDLPLTSDFSGTFAGDITVTGTPVPAESGCVFEAGDRLDLQLSGNINRYAGTVVFECASIPTSTGTTIPISTGVSSNLGYKGVGGTTMSVQLPPASTMGGPLWPNTGVNVKIAVARDSFANSQKIMSSLSTKVVTFTYDTDALEIGSVLRIGSRSDGLYQWLGTIKNLKIYNALMSNTELVTAIGVDTANLNIIAHRGYLSEAPENTIAALTAAFLAGATDIECDIQVSSDGGLVIIHDATVDRTTEGTGNVKDLELATLRALDAGTHFSAAFAGEKILLLSEVLQLLVDNPGVTLHAEIKGYRTTADIALMVQPIIDAGLEDRVILQSFVFTDFPHVRTLSSQIKIAPLCDDASFDVALAAATSDGNAAVYAAAVAITGTPARVAACESAGVGLAVWTVDTWAGVTALMALGVNDIMSNWALERLVTK